MSEGISDLVVPTENNPCTKKKRCRLSLAEKIEASRRLSCGNTVACVAKEFGVSVRTVKRIKRDAHHFASINVSDQISLHSKTIRAPNFPFLEAKLFDFVTFARAAKLPVTSSVLHTKAILIRDELLKVPTISVENSSALRSFSASVGWVVNFVKRNALRLVPLHEPPVNIDVAAVAAGISALRQRLASYSLECIYSVDETGLFYKLLPSKMYTTMDEGRKSVRRTKNMSAKDRVTAYVCTNADGSDKLPMAVIGTAKTPRCFKNMPPPIPYFSQKGAWSDTATFRKWYYDVFLPHIREKTCEGVILLIDNCGPQGTDLVDKTGQVNIISLPANCKAVHQPMDAGVITAFKVRYRCELLRRIIENVEHREELQKAALHFKCGTKGIGEGHDPHLLDVAEIVEEVWDSISKRMIARCWLKADILPLPMVDALTGEHGKTRKLNAFPKDVNVSKICAMVSKLSLNDSVTGVVSGDEQITEKDVRLWLNVEESPAVAESVVKDLMDDLELNWYEGSVHSTYNEDEVEDGVCDYNECMIMPAPAVIAEKFKDLEKLAFGMGLEDGISHLRKAKKAFQLAYSEQQSGVIRASVLEDALAIAAMMEPPPQL